MEIYAKLAQHMVGERHEGNALRISLCAGYVVTPFAILAIGSDIAACQDFERLRAEPQLLIHPLVVCASQEWDADLEERTHSVSIII